MMSKRKPYQTFTKEFKLEAVRLLQETDKTAADIARELGIRRNQLYKWKEQLIQKGEVAFAGQVGRPKREDQSEVTKLKQENDRLREEVDILKKAAAYFAKELK